MHTATNYYLFSLAISDLFLLISALLPEMYRIWSPENYIFGQTFCIIQGFAAETSVNATVLTITAFTVERYVAICHPFLSHTIAKLSRIVKFIIAIWVAALCLAIPQAIQFGVEYDVRDNVETSMCSVVTEGLFQHSFEISTFLFFVGPMTLITVLYVLIALKLRKSGKQCRISRSSRNSVAQKKVIKMLVEDTHGKLGVPLRKLGRKYKIDKKYASDILKKENVTLKARKAAPKYTEKQQNEQKHKLRQLSENKFSSSNDLEVIIYDESFYR
ncbi:g-protein coupled receptor [Holotrichia oblita]|uniref:G-protein coupled receptor n=1 Tax=Holotrichia oblita TaxID=644536 RepID=A0ACB9SZC4_HOLOL|nr:g-protein coupled receptor [Holotrichia oblita]